MKGRAVASKRSTQALSIALICAAAPFTATAEEVASVRHRAIDQIFAQYDQPGSPGAAIGIIRGGEVEYVRTYGYAELENAVPITEHTVFDVASVSKQFTAYAIMLLVREGKVSLDADIRQYLPYVPDFGSRITPRHLLQHTSGLRDQFRLLDLGGQDERSPTTQQQILNLVKRQRSLNFEPGAEHEYCNTGYILLAEIVRAASGRSLREFAQERIFGPLGMTRSLFYDDLTEVIPNRASSYERHEASSPWRRYTDNYSYVGPTGVQTTIGDLLKWARNMARPRPGDAGIFREMTEWGRLNDGTPFGKGLGLGAWTFSGERAVSHSGTMGRFVSLFAWFPERDFAAVLLMNSDGPNYDYLDRIVAAYFDPDGSKLKARERAAGFAEARPRDRLLRAAAGHYMNDSDLMLSLVYENGTLFLDERGAERVPVHFRANGRFDASYPKWRSYRLRQEKSRVVGLEADIDELPTVFFRRVEIPALTVQQLAAVAGDYYSDEIDGTLSIAFDGQNLAATTLWLDEPIPLHAVTPDRFETDSAILHSVLLDRDANGTVTAIRANCYRGLRNLVMRRMSP